MTGKTPTCGRRWCRSTRTTGRYAPTTAVRTPTVSTSQAGLQTGSSFKVFALVAALEQGIGLGYQVDSAPLTVDGIKITNVDGESCGTCNIAQALKQSLNTSYYRLMLKLKGGPQAVADAAHQAGIATSFPGVDHTVRGRKAGRPTTELCWGSTRPG